RNVVLGRQAPAGRRGGTFVKRQAAAPAKPDPRSAPSSRGARKTMPLVAVDIGNTETVVGRFTGGQLEESWRLTSGRTTADELRLSLEAMLRTRGAGSASVV